MAQITLRPRVRNGEMVGYTLRVASRETLPNQSVGTLAWRDMKCEQGITRYLIERRLRAIELRQQVRTIVGWLLYGTIIVALVYGGVIWFAEVVG